MTEKTNKAIRTGKEEIQQFEDDKVEKKQWEVVVIVDKLEVAEVNLMIDYFQNEYQMLEYKVPKRVLEKNWN